MNRDDLLTKLAMELEEWPRDLPGPNLPGLWSCHHVWRCHAPGDRKAIFENEWIARRTELINRPSWDDAPEWAQWLAQDEGGTWTWFEAPAEPEEEEGYWLEKEGEDAEISAAAKGTTPAGHDWRDTLEQRPQAQSDIKKCNQLRSRCQVCGIDFARPRQADVPDGYCTRCWASAEAFSAAQDDLADAWDRDRAIADIALAVSPDNWPEGRTVHHKGHDITWEEYVTRQHEIEEAELEEEFTVEPWPEERMDVIGTNGPTGDHYAEDNDSEAARERTIEDVVADWQAAHPEVMARSKYHREVKPGVWIDVYDVLQAWGVTNPADAHSIKKMLMPGQRGAKGAIQDRREAIASLERAIELESEA